MRRQWRAWLVGLVGVLGLGEAPVAAQEPALPIAQALVDRDGDGVPDRLGDTVTVGGVLLSDAAVASPTTSLANLQDETAGVILFARDTTQLPGLVAGDSVRVRGRISQYRGAEELVVVALERTGHVGVPRPRDVLVAELQGERLSGRLVRVAGVLRAEQGEEEIEARIEDRTGSIPVHVSSSWLQDPSFVERLFEGGAVQVVGMATQRTAGNAAVGGYRLRPRDASDFGFVPGPPYRLLAGLAAAVGLGLFGLWHVAERRRARELERLASELKRSREELRRREERFRSLVENAADTVSILSASGAVLYQSPSARRMLGWELEELEERGAVELVHPDDRESTQRALAKLAGEPRGFMEIEFRFRAKDGSWHHLEVHGTNRLHDPAVEGIVCNARDVTQHRVLEERLRNADRLEAVGRLAGGIAHDFNNVLTALRGHAELALEATDVGCVGRTDLEEITRAAERAASLTRQLLAFTRQQVMRPRVVDPVGIVEEMAPMLGRLIGDDITLETRLDPDSGAVRADPSQLEQVVMNLVVNARDAMPDGGTVTIQLAPDRIDPDRAARYPYDVTPGPYVRLTVQDTGVGMDDEVLQHVFDPFFTTKEHGEGTGLGLATLYGIVKQSGGYVWAASAPGEGSRFDVYLPRLDAEVERGRQPAAAPGERTRGRGETILLVEDEPGVRRLAKRVLERGGYRVLEAEDGADALDRAGGRLEEVDLLLTDVIMPGMSGGELAERLRALRPGLPTVFASGYTRDEVVRRGVGAGDAAFLEKPFTPDALLRQVRAALDPVAAAPG